MDIKIIPKVDECLNCGRNISEYFLNKGQEYPEQICLNCGHNISEYFLTKGQEYPEQICLNCGHNMSEYFLTSGQEYREQICSDCKAVKRITNFNNIKNTFKKELLFFSK